MSVEIFPDTAVPTDTSLATQNIEAIIPPELLTRCLDFLDLDDILRFMATNRSLNALGRDHPKYWRSLSLNLSRSADSRNIQHFRLRLSRSRGRPVDIHIYCGDSISSRADYSLSTSAERDLLPDISSHLCHIHMLIWDLHDDTIVEELFDAIAHPAPMLEILMLSCSFPSPARPTVRADLLAGFAPALYLASFVCLGLPEPVPACLFDVDQLSIHNATVPDLSQACPRLRALYLGDQVTLHDVFHTQAAWDNIQHLSLLKGQIARDWYSIGLPISSVPSVLVHLNYTHPDEHAGVARCLARLAAHLEGDVGVYLIHPMAARGVLTFHLRGTLARTRHLERTLHTAQNFGMIPGPPLRGAAAGFSGRIVYLVIRLKSWDSTMHLGSLPALKDLVLLVTNEATPQTPAQLSCPALQRLIIRQRRWRADVFVMAIAPLAQFARLALLDARFPLALELQGARLQVDAECDPATFRGPVMTAAPDDVRSL